MRVLVTGATGMIGRALMEAGAAEGHTMVPLRRVRAPDPAPGAGPWWNPPAGAIDRAGIEGCDAVVHLAGATLAKRFTRAHLRNVRESRERPTGLLATTLAGLARPPRVLVSSSGVNLYGDRGEAPLDESAAPGNDTLAEIAKAWEGATTAAERAGIRVVRARTAMVLAGGGGALAPMLPLARLGLGGPLGSGRQWWSWIALDDVTRAILHAIRDDGLAGAVNLAAPGAVRQAEFARVLGRVLGRPAFVPAPAFALRLVLGRGMADALVLSSMRVVPGRLLARDFAFRYPDLEPALRAVLGR